VERGDTVVRIAQRHGTLSSNVVTAEGQLPNPYRLFPGQILYVRPISEPKPTTHIVVPGETLPKIAAQHKVSAQAILAVNPGVDFSLIIAGQTVHVPSDAGKPRQLPRCLALQFAEMVLALLVLQAQAGQMQALQTQPLQELEKLASDLADNVSEHLKAEKGFKAALAVAILGICAAVHPHRGLAIATAVLGAVATSLSGLSSVCNFAGRATQNEDAVMYYSEGQNTALRRLKLLIRSLNVDPDDVIQACTDVNEYVDPSSSAGRKYQSERKTGWTFNLKPYFCLDHC